MLDIRLGKTVTYYLYRGKNFSMVKILGLIIKGLIDKFKFVFDKFNN